MKKQLLLFIPLFNFSPTTSQIENQTPDEHLSMCGPILPICTPTSINTGLGVGISYFSLNQISNPSTNNSAGGYQDFTCSDSTFLNQGDSYAAEIITGQTYGEVIRIWVDFNNDGAFDSLELIFADLPLVYSHWGIVTIPVTGQTGAPLRMRIGSEVKFYSPPDGCNDVQYGQYEDYTVYLNGPTGLHERQKENPVSLSPNPFHTAAKLSCSQQSAQKILQLRIFNTMGVLVRTEKILNITSYLLHRRDLRDGLYFYELRTPDSEIIGTGKFVIQ